MPLPDIRVERGCVEPEEIAALAAVCLARAAAHRILRNPHSRAKTLWSRMERETSLRASHGWR